jgi:hypothetical protein
VTLVRYEELATLAERELELVRAGQLDELAALQHRRDELVAALPTYPPAEARPALERAARLRRDTTVALATSLRSVVEQLGHVGTGRRAASSYAPSVPGRTVDQSA